jgi:hypothetical protein
MATYPVPLIRRQDYEAFRGIPTRNLPDTFDQWQYKHAEQAAHITGGGHIAEYIEIDPQEFADFCHATGQEASLQTIRFFAEEQFRRKP